MNKPHPVTRLNRFAIRQLFLQKKPKAACTALDSASLKRILVIRLDEIGDVILMSPFLRELRRNLPHANITLIVKPAVYNLVEHCPYVDNIVRFAATSWRYPLRSFLQARRFALQTLACERYDLSLHPRWDADWSGAAFLGYFSGAKHRLAFSEQVSPLKSIVNRGYDRLFTHTVSDTAVKHEVERNLRMLCHLGFSIESDDLEIWTANEDSVYANKTLTAHHVAPEDTVVVLGIGAGHRNKCWPLQRFAELGRRLRSCGHTLLVLGSEEETDLANQLQTEIGVGVINVAGHATLRQSAELLARCHLFIGNDSSPMHMAAAMHVPIVEICSHPKTGSLHHERSPVRFHPWTSDYVLVQPDTGSGRCSDGCDARSAHCIRNVTVDMVHHAATQQLAKGLHAATERN